MMKSEKKDYTERTRAMRPDCMCTSDACARFSGNVCGRDDLEHKYDFTVIGTAATVTVLKVSEMPQRGKIHCGDRRRPSKLGKRRHGA